MQATVSAASRRQPGASTHCTSSLMLRPQDTAGCGGSNTSDHTPSTTGTGPKLRRPSGVIARSKSTIRARQSEVPWTTIRSGGLPAADWMPVTESMAILHMTPPCAVCRHGHDAMHWMRGRSTGSTPGPHGIGHGAICRPAQPPRPRRSIPAGPGPRPVQGPAAHPADTARGRRPARIPARRRAGTGA